MTQPTASTEMEDATPRTPDSSQPLNFFPRMEGGQNGGQQQQQQQQQQQPVQQQTEQFQLYLAPSGHGGNLASALPFNLSSALSSLLQSSGDGGGGGNIGPGPFGSNGSRRANPIDPTQLYPSPPWETSLLSTLGAQSSIQPQNGFPGQISANGTLGNFGAFGGTGFGTDLSQAVRGLPALQQLSAGLSSDILNFYQPSASQFATNSAALFNAPLPSSQMQMQSPQHQTQSLIPVLPVNERMQAAANGMLQNITSPIASPTGSANNNKSSSSPVQQQMHVQPESVSPRERSRFQLPPPPTRSLPASRPTTRKSSVSKPRASAPLRTSSRTHGMSLRAVLAAANESEQQESKYLEHDEEEEEEEIEEEQEGYHHQDPDGEHELDPEYPAQSPVLPAPTRSRNRRQSSFSSVMRTSSSGSSVGMPGVDYKVPVDAKPIKGVLMVAENGRRKRVYNNSDEEDKANRKRQRNTESARRARVRRMENLRQMEQRISELEGENEELKRTVLELRRDLEVSNPAGSEATPMHYEPTPPTTRGARSNAQRGGRSRGRGSKRNTRRGSTEGLN